MAASKKKKKPSGSVMKSVLIKFFSFIFAILIAWMLIEGSAVRLKSSVLPLRDLPSAFEGTRVLYLSDLHINSFNTPEKVSALMEELKKLNPDLLLLGGDYSSFDPIMRISAGSSGKTGVYALETELRDLFFLSLSDFNPPLGKFGIAGEHDNLLERNSGTLLRDAMALGGVTLLKDEAVRISKDGASLTLVGADDWSTGLQDTRTLSDLVSARECVILLSHNPEAIPQLNNRPAADGLWIDAALSGHTHGGGIELFGMELFNPLGREDRYRAGWHKENGAKMLISRGVGSDLLPMRLHASPEAHLITLSRAVY